MEFTNTFIRDANNVFQLCEAAEIIQLVRGLSLENNNTFNMYLMTKIDGDEIEIPMIARKLVEKAIFQNIALSTGEVDAQTILFPLYENSIPREVRTFNGCITHFFTYTDYSRRLQKITTSKGEIYHGGRGLIFDSQYNPLILCTLKARKVKEDDMFKMKYFKPVIYISPKVFEEQDKLVNKGIIKKLIPFYTSREVFFPTVRCSTFYNEQSFAREKKATVIVGSLDRFFTKPIVPKPNSCTMESLNDCLVNNIDDILEAL